MFTNRYYCKSLILSFKHLVVLSLLLISIFSLSAQATDIRGRVQVPTNYNPGWSPRPYANVVLLTFNRSNQPVYLTAYTTGSDGMYFFYNLRSGPYRVVVNNGPYVDFAIGNSRSFDVNPIWIN